jgi:4-hydroxybenzoate polyprenyltransferase
VAQRARRPGWNQIFHDIVVVHRLEYPLPVNYLCYAAWGACFAVPHARDLLGAGALSAIVANLLLIVSALLLNTAADIPTDQHHAERSHLASAALRVGRGRLLRWVAMEMLCAVVLVLVVWARSGRWFVLGAAAAMILLQVLYNVEPSRLKRRGFVGVCAFCTAVVVLPFLLSYYAVAPNLDWSVWPILLGVGLLAIGRMTGWSILDRTADAATGIGTPAVRHGAARALTLACSTMAAGLTLTASGLWWRYGFVRAIPVVCCHGGAIVLLRRIVGEAEPSSVRFQRRVMPLVAVGDLVLAITPLVAGQPLS